MEEFVRFAKGLQRGKSTLQALAASPAADRFANRLVAEALSGEAHAPACLSLIGHLVRDDFWVGKLRSSNPMGDAPSPNDLRPKDIEPVSRALLVVLPEDAALAWIALAFLTMKGAEVSRSAALNLLVQRATTPSAFLDALSHGLLAIESDGRRIGGSVASRSIEAIEKYASPRRADANTPTVGNVLARALSTAKRTEIGPLVDALLSLQAGARIASDGNHIGRDDDTSPDSNEVIAEAAWRQADDALARTLQNAAALTHALDQAGEVDNAVRDCVEIVAQAVEDAAARRELELEGKVGETANFDPATHHSDQPGLGPDSVVRVTLPAVAQGRTSWRKIIRKAEIMPQLQSQK